MRDNFYNLILRGIFAVFLGVFLTSCDLSTPTHTGDDSVFPSKNLRAVSYSDLPEWENDDLICASSFP